MLVDLAILLAIIGVFLSAFVAITNYMRGRRQENQNEAASLSTVLADIKYIMRGIEEIKKDIKEDIKLEIKEIKDRQTTQAETIAILTRDLKSAHRRVDELLELKRTED